MRRAAKTAWTDQMHNPIRSEWSRMMLELASRPCGTNTYECARVLGGSSAHASERLRGLANNGHLDVVPEDKSTGRMNQYFTDGKDAVAWKELADPQKPNVAYRDRYIAAKKNHKRGASIAPPKKIQHRIQSATWAKAPLVGNVNAVKPTKVRTSGLALGHDCRYQLSPDEAKALEGEFGKLGPGRYLEEK